MLVSTGRSSEHVLDSRKLREIMRTLLCGYLLLVTTSASAAGLSDGQREFFETKIRPVLIKHCYSCHNSAKEAAGSLALDDREGLLKGGDGGAIIVPGKPQQSRLISILKHEVSGLEMPQDGTKFEPNVIADFERWIEMGAPDPRDMPPTADELARATSWEATFAKRSNWWSFKPVVKTTPPDMQSGQSPSHPVDRFLQAEIESRRLAPADIADKRTLLRRLSFVLTGLPPTPEEIGQFVEDDSADAYGKLVDRLLNSERFGERWARHWMDLVRYSESHGSQGDPELANAYRYRDYLIRAFNNDVPYDQLVREHIAGDLLAEPRWNADAQINESAIGPAHLRMVELGFVPVDALEDQVKVVDNQIDVYSKAFLGLTASCARCHSHKFDPISQEDFYALYGIFVSGRPGQVLIDSPKVLNRHRAELTSLKSEIREGLATAWLDAVADVETRLHEEPKRAEKLVDLRSRLEKNRLAIAAIEEPARAVVLQRRPGQGQRRSGDNAAHDDQMPEQPRSAPRSGLPTPYARWSFDGDARDSVGSHHGQLLDGAVIRDGRLVLDGRASSMRTSALDRDIREKTLEAWVSLANFNQRGIGVIGLDTPGDQFFDSIVFGEQKPKHWMAGSDFFRRTQEPGGIEETTPPDQLIHMVIVYAKDNSITLYRNGRLYGKPYTKGTLQLFEKGKSRFLFGQRLSGVNPPLAGEIEEARAYTRALTAEEIAASFTAGPEGVSTDELLAVLDADQRKRLVALHETRNQLRAALQQLDPADGDNTDSWVRAFEEARSNQENALHAWVQVTTTGATTATELRTRWTELVDHWKSTLKTRREFNDANFKPAWDLKTQHDDWFGYGTSFPGNRLRSEPTGTFTIEPDGERVVTGIHAAGVFSHSLSNRHTAVLSSPRFVIDSNAVAVRALGNNARVRLVIENYPRGNGGIYPAITLDRDQSGWHVLNSEYRKGQRAYLQIETNLTERAHFAIDQIVTSNGQQPPFERVVPVSVLLQGNAPSSLNELATRYATTLQQTVRSWQSGSINEDEAAFLDFFIRRGLLPTTIDALPDQVRELITQYRALEKQIPVPRRAPGMLETAGYDQPLFERGRHTRPGEPVPRRGLSLFDDRPFHATDSGRLKLAEQTASAGNPLTARVFVNRLWHYVFGQGIVRTVDNFGHLGERPSHPELLDYLAARFVEDGWSIRNMLRLLVTSRTFQQSSRASDAALQIDPANRLLSHMPVRRLDADAIRDSMLAASGQIDLKMFGPGINVYYTTKTEGGGPKGPLDGDRRRSVYLRIRRNAHNPFLEAFDAPKPTTTRGRRDVTNVPAQSLTMLNDPFVIDQAAKWAKQVVAEKRESIERVRTMYERAFAREPTTAETQATLEYVAALEREHTSAPDDASREHLVWQDVAHSMFCLKEFIHVE
ncbi:MAG: DUF1553 domain-containing protein [Planctomycetota bacterium]|jgi:hypothetical protein